jgi:hypothetical protein
MLGRNIKRLKNAYRHPFEYISPELYRDCQLDDSSRDASGPLVPQTPSGLFIADEDIFNKLMEDFIEKN